MGPPATVSIYAMYANRRTWWTPWWRFVAVTDRQSIGLLPKASRHAGREELRPMTKTEREINERIAKLAAEAPPLTPEQRARLAALFGATDQSTVLEHT